MPASLPRVFQGSETYPDVPLEGPAVTIGNFDGVHLGHRALLRAARERVGPSGRVCVYTFDPFPRDVMAPGHGVPAIQTLPDRVATLGTAGVDEVVVEPFDRDFAQHDPTWFCDVVLRQRLRARAVVVGWDFRFGRDRAGDVDLLRQRLSVPVVRVPAVAVEGDVVSSTRIRALVAAGDLATAERLLARPHAVSGEVVPGDARGRSLGFPTANVRPATDLLPPAGVYAVRVDVSGVWLDGVANLGDRPTFRPGEGRLEVHLLDWSGDLYGVQVTVAFVRRIREERAFARVDDLVAQIRVDAEAARRILGQRR
ncbi:MAG: bifunctional riboflavin kinase/FAD synthetase [Alphaproteobacteria bacterium]|nr:bifunctional riboflavin kinase/FAD synthetase [Alphaproteobacteria bacterium]